MERKGTEGEEKEGEGKGRGEGMEFRENFVIGFSG